MTTDKQREAFEREYATGDAVSDSISLARREDGEYEQALARMCFKWFCKGQKARPFDFVSALKEAEAIVASYPLHKKFIDGTPLQNDIAVMMAEFAGTYSGQAAQQPSVSEDDIAKVLWLDNGGIEYVYDNMREKSGAEGWVQKQRCLSQAKALLARFTVSERGK